MAYQKYELGEGEFIMYKLAVAVNDIYGISVDNAKLSKGVFFLDTKEGIKILKKIAIWNERIEFVYFFQEYLIDKGFYNVDRFILTKEEKPYFTLNNMNFVLKEHVQGEEVNFEYTADAVQAAKMLARFHNVSEGFEAPDDIVIPDNLGKLIDVYNRRSVELTKNYKKALKRRGEFDNLYIAYYDYFMQNAEIAKKIINGSSYDISVQKTRERKGICHHDYNQHNLIKANKDYYIINLDYCCLDLAVYDLANLLRRRLRKCKWSLSDGNKIISEYTKYKSLSYEELNVLRAMLYFPQKYWRVSNKYYNSKVGRFEKSHLNMMEETVREIPYFIKFMQDFFNQEPKQNI
jgi:CotS family spore coat protein